MLQGLDSSVIVAVCSVSGAAFGWLVAVTKARIEKRKLLLARQQVAERAQDADQQRAINERSEMVKILNAEIIQPLRKELGDLRDTVNEQGVRIKSLEDQNSGLVRFIYILLGIVRKHDAIEDIQTADIPPGIHV